MVRRPYLSLLLILLLLLSPAANAEAVDSLCVWYPYWGIAEEIPEGVDALSLFAISYTPEGELYAPEELEIVLANAAFFQGPKYLTFVNDVFCPDGRTIQKSTALLDILLSDDARDSAIAAMLSKTRDLGCTGLDLDFEQIAKFPQYHEPFAQFVRELSAQAAAAELTLRVVLEPGWDPAFAELPPEPTYTVMCYNLFGAHSGPGPKADCAFLTALADRFQSLPNLRFALATGGFDWDPAGKAAQLTTEQAALLVSNHAALRDPDSGALTFSYSAEDGVHQVWYADPTTIALWADTLTSALGHPAAIDLWRAEIGLSYSQIVAAIS